MRQIALVNSAIAVAILNCLVLPDSAWSQDPPQYRVYSIEDEQGNGHRATDINNQGLAVVGGHFSGEPHLYVHPTRTLHDLNELEGVTWVDMDTGEMWDQDTTPWVAFSALGINESNQVVGWAFADIGPDRAYLLLDPLGPDPVYHLLPNFGGGVRGVAINDIGVVVGSALGQVVVFDPRSQPDAFSPVGIQLPVDFGSTREAREINNHGDIVVGFTVEIDGYVISPDGNNPDGSFNYSNAVVSFYSEDAFFGINDSRQICGRRYSFPNLQNFGPLRFQYFAPGDPNHPGMITDANLLAVGEAGAFCDVNECGDVAFGRHDNDRAYVYLENLDDSGPFALDQLVVFDSPEVEANWMASSLAQPNGINDAGQIIIRGSNGRQFFLEPVSNLPLLGDVNLDGEVNLLDVQPFVDLLTSGGFQDEADMNQDGLFNLLDVHPFVELLTGG